MAFAGLRGTGSWGTDERPKDFREMILWLQPNGTTPLTALMAKARKEKATDPEYAWWEETLQQVRVENDAALAATTASTSVTLVSGGLSLVPGDVLLVEKADTTIYDNEIIVVSSVTSDTAIVVKRAQAGSSASAIADGDFFTRIGSAFAEGTSSPDASQRNPTKKFNYCQIFKTKIAQAKSVLGTKARTGKAWENDKKRKSFDHAVNMELAFLFGQKHETTGANGLPLRYTGGLRSFITTNVTVFATTPTEDTLLDALAPVFDYSKSQAGDERIVFAGNGFLNSLNKLARNSSSTRVNFDSIIEVYGMKLARWIIPQGTLGIKTHPLLNTHPRYKDAAFVIDPTGLKTRFLEGRSTKFEDNIQANDADTREGQWIGEEGLEVQHEETMAYIGNFVV